MNIITVLNELHKGDVFTTKGDVVYNKKPQMFEGSKGKFYTQFLLLQDESTGHSPDNRSLPIAVSVKEGEAFQNGQILNIKGMVDEWKGELKYKGRVTGVEVDEDEEKVKDLFNQAFGKEKKEEIKENTNGSNTSKEGSIARSVAIKAAAEMVAGKAFKIADFWTWVYSMEDYLLLGCQEEAETVEEELEITTDAEILEPEIIPADQKTQYTPEIPF